MQLDFNKDGNLEGVLTLSIVGNDYQGSLTDSLKKYQKTMRFPGFRVGKTPFGLVKKQLGSDLKRDEVNKLIQTKVSEYYKENQSTIIFMPMMDDLADDFSWETDDFAFTFRVAMRPDVNVDLTSLSSVESRVLKLDDSDLENEINNLKKQYGDIDRLDEVVEDPNLVVVFKATELDEGGEELKDGFTKMVRLEGDAIPEKLIKELVGKKNEDEFTLNLKSLLKQKELIEILEIEKPMAKDLGDSFKIKMQGAIILKPAELNEAFYEKVFYDNSIADEEAFRTKISENLVQFFDDKDQGYLQKTVKDALMDKTNIALPVDFLKVWFERNANLKEEDNFDEKFASFMQDTKWDLILEHLADTMEQKVEEEEIKNSIRSYVLQQYGYQVQNLDKEQIESMTENLYNQEYFRIELRQNILANKVVKELKNKGTFTNVELNKPQFEEFVKENEL